MELLRLKKRVLLAQRGHRLLKDKQDELIKQFMPLVKEVIGLRKEVEEGLKKAFQSFVTARMLMPPEFIEEALMWSGERITLEVSYKHIVGVKVPEYEIKKEGDIYNYGLATTSSELDVALKAYSDLLPSLVKLASLEKTLELLAAEIERTRRRVNALEYIFIPNLEETIKYITMKLSEMERADLTRLMRIKEIVRAH
jgi:V/A-type H+-transporting ATPase subunit D